MLSFFKKTFPLTFKDFQLFIVFSAILIGFTFVSESVLDKPGYGPDATIYASWVKNTPAFIHQTVNPYHFQKTLPSISVNLVMRIFNLDLSEENIKLTFSLFTHSARILAIFFFLLIFSELNYSKIQKFVGLSVIVFTKLILLSPTYAAISIDSPAVLLSAIILWAYLRNNLIVLTITSFFAAFTWPSLLIFSSFLFIFPVPNSIKSTGTQLPQFAYHIIMKLCKWIPMLMSLFIISLTLYLFHSGEYLEWAKPAIMIEYTEIVAYPWFALSLLIIWGFIFYIFKHALNSDLVLDYIKTLNIKQILLRIIIYIPLFVVVKLITTHFSAPIPPVVSFKRIISTTLIFGATFPGTFITNHIIFYGPIVILLLYYYKDILANIINKSGLGLVGSILTGAIFGLNSETRYFFNIIHILIIFAIPVLAEKLNKNTFKSLIPLHIIFSMIWIPFFAMISDSTIFKTRTHLINGPWMSYDQIMIYNGIIAIVILIFIYLQKKGKTMFL